MSLSTLFGFATGTASEELPEIFPLTFKKDEFIKTDVVNIYSKILTDVVERTSGLDDDEKQLLWDSCVMSSSTDGLLTMLAKAMTDKRELFLVYEDGGIGVIREATQEEVTQIKAEYKSSTKSTIGVYVSFKNYLRSDMLKLYSGLEYCTVGSLHKQMNLSKAIQFKMKNMRSTVGAADSAKAITQAQNIAKGLGLGKDVVMDGDDTIDTGKTDLAPTKEAMTYLNERRSFYLGLPASYIMGEQTGGIGSTGEGDTKAVERGLKNYYFSIIKPVLEALFEVSLNYKSQDFRQIAQANETMKTFDLVGEEYISKENKKKIIEGLLDIDPDDNKTEFQKEPTTPPPATGSNFNQRV